MISLDTCRKYVKSEQEGLELIALPVCEELMQMSASAAMNKKAEDDGVQLGSIKFQPMVLCVNLDRSGLFSDYTHFIQMIATAEVKKDKQ